LFWNPTVLNEFAPALAAAPAPLVKRFEASKLELYTSAVDVGRVFSPVKSQAAICAEDCVILRAKKHTGSMMYCRHLIMVFDISNFVKKWKGGFGFGAGAKIWYSYIIRCYPEN
jgi:hypothetical protein